MTKKLTSILLVVGIVLVVSALVLLMVTRVSIPNNKENAASIVKELLSLMPDVKGGFPDDKGNPAMSCIELDGVDFSGILEIPVYDVCLPVANKWSAEDVNKYPHRFSGSIYDNSLIVGGSDNNGQFDFMKNISKSDVLFYTDMLGVRCSYIVDDIIITNDVSYESLSNGEWDLAFFARNSYGFDYTVVRCKLK